MFAKKMKTSDKKNKTFRFKDLYLPTFSLSLSGYRFILLLRKGRMLGVTAKLGTGFRGTCCRIRQNLYQDSEYFSRKVAVSRLHKLTVFIAQACFVHRTGQACAINTVDKVVAAGIFLA